MVLFLCISFIFYGFIKANYRGYIQAVLFFRYRQCIIIALVVQRNFLYISFAFYGFISYIFLYFAVLFFLYFFYILWSYLYTFFLYFMVLFLIHFLYILRFIYGPLNGRTVYFTGRK